MGFIEVETPDGFAEFEVEGDKPTEQELMEIQRVVIGEGQPREGFVDLTEPLFETEERETVAREPAEPAFTPDHEGEVEDHIFQFMYGRADTDKERASRLKEIFGPGTYERVGRDDFILKLDNISPELKDKYDLPESGTIRVNEPGLSWYDVSGFFGAEAAPLGTALGAGLMFSGIGIVPGMLLMAAAGATGKAIDELVIEKMEGHQLQSDDEIYGDIAITGALYGLGEGIGRTVFAVGRRLIKGPGPKADPAVVERLIERGMSRPAANIAAREEAKTELRAAVKAGARPTIREVSGKAIMGRLQSIYEGIFPNAKAAGKNFRYVTQILDDMGAGRITEAEAKEGLNRQAQAISAHISNLMKNADVDEAVRLANRHLEKVIDNEFKILLEIYNPNIKLDTGFVQLLNQSARMFDQDSSVLYKKAEAILKGVLDVEGKNAATFSAATLKSIVTKIQEDKATTAVAGDAFNKGLFTYILGKDSFTLTELSSLRSALRLAGQDPGLMPGISDAHIGSIIQGIGKTMDNRLEGLAYLGTEPGRRMAQGMMRGNINIGSPEFNEATRQMFKNGLEAYRLAKDVHAKGVQRFKDFSTDALFKGLKSGQIKGPQDVLPLVLQPGNATKLRSYLKAVTPSGKTLEGIQRIESSVFDDAAKILASGQKGSIKQYNKILTDAGVPDELVAKIPSFLDDVAVNDPNRRNVIRQAIEVLRNYGKMAEARANPRVIRESFRDALAREWLQTTQRTSLGPAGSFSPPQFASKFYSLGDDVQNVLFGKDNATALRQLMQDYQKVGFTSKQFADATAETLGTTARAIRSRTMGLTSGRSIPEEVSRLQGIMREAERQSEDALFQAVKTGHMQNADDLVLAVLKNPDNYRRLSKEFGDDVLGGPLNVKDMVMSRIMSAAFPDGINPQVVASGSWGGAMRRSISDLNKNGALATVLGDGRRKAGQAMVDDMIRFSKLGERISDQALKSQQGLAAAAFAAGAGFRLVTEPVSFLGEAAAIFTMGRVMRQKWFLKTLLSPNYSAGFWGVKGGRRLYQQATRQGLKLKGPGTRVNPLALELRERVAQEARLITSALNEPSSEGRQRARELVSENITQPIRQITSPGVSLGGGAAVTPALGPEVLREQARRGAGLDPATILGLRQ